MGLRATRFIGASSGTWAVREVRTERGTPLPVTTMISVVSADAPAPDRCDWTLLGVGSHERYVHRPERTQLQAVQPTLGRAEATHAALIPITKSATWWALTQDERRAIFEEQSAHIAVGLDYLPAIARKLYHARDLGEPFDFLTWFEFAPEHEAQFEDMLGRMRAAREWEFVDREIDIRLERTVMR